MDTHATVLTVSVVVVFVVVLMLVSSNKCGCNKTKQKQSDNFQDGVLSFDDFEVYLINMTKNADRLNAFIDQYKGSDLGVKNFYRFEAIDGRTLNLADYVSPRALKEIEDAEKNGYRIKHYQLTPGGVGCYLSHQKVLRIISEADKPFGIVFEDDVLIDPKIYNKMTMTMAQIPDDWDILLLGCYCIKCVKYEEHAVMDRFFQTHGYVVKRDSALKITQYLDKTLIEQQIDTVMSEMTQEGIIKIYCLNNNLARQNRLFTTTIQLPLNYKSGVDPYETVNNVNKT